MPSFPLKTLKKGNPKMPQAEKGNTFVCEEMLLKDMKKD